MGVAMGSTLDLGRRIELVSMDPHFSDITIGLYEPAADGAPEYLVHSYSGLAGVRGRLEAIVRAMQVLGGLELHDGRLHFPCAVKHQLAMRRVFLEACKLAPQATLEPRPLTVLEKKLNILITARSLAGGLYELTAEGPPEVSAARVESIAGGMRKLAEIVPLPGEPHRFQFACGQPHDALVGLLLPRALNVRAILREQEMAATRGVLVAPSAQN
jgi:hypothetical protein